MTASWRAAQRSSATRRDIDIVTPVGNWWDGVT